MVIEMARALHIYVERTVAQGWPARLDGGRSQLDDFLRSGAAVCWRSTVEGQIRFRRGNEGHRSSGRGRARAAGCKARERPKRLAWEVEAYLDRLGCFVGGSKWKFEWLLRLWEILGRRAESAVEGGNRGKDGWMDLDGEGGRSAAADRANAGSRGPSQIQRLRSFGNILGSFNVLLFLVIKLEGRPPRDYSVLESLADRSSLARYLSRGNDKVQVLTGLAADAGREGTGTPYLHGVGSQGKRVRG